MSLTKIAEKYGNIFSLRLGNKLVVVLNGAKAISEGLAKRSVLSGRPDLLCFELYKGGETSGCLILGHSRKWKLLRKVCHDSLLKYLKTEIFEEQVEKESQRLIDCLREQRGKPVDPGNLLKFATGNVILNILFGNDYDYSDKEFLEVVHSEKVMQKLLATNSAVNILPWLYFWYRKDVNELRQVLTRGLSFVEKQLKLHREANISEGQTQNLSDCLFKAAQRENQKAAENVDGDKGGEKLQFTDEDLVHTLRDMFAAGFETSSQTMRWALAIFANRPDIQSKLHKELDTTFPEVHFLSVRNTEKLPYLRATVYEVLRFTSLAPLSIPHSSTADAVIEGYSIPKDTMIIPNLWSVNRDPKMWKDPDVFNPERFLDGDGKEIDMKLVPSFMPFSTGHRRCLGENLTYVELFTFLAGLLLNFRFSLEGSQEFDMTPECHIILTAKPYTLKVEERQKGVRKNRISGQ